MTAFSVFMLGKLVFLGFSCVFFAVIAASRLNPAASLFFKKKKKNHQDYVLFVCFLTFFNASLLHTYIHGAPEGMRHWYSQYFKSHKQEMHGKLVFLVSVFFVVVFSKFYCQCFTSDSSGFSLLLFFFFLFFFLF